MARAVAMNETASPDFRMILFKAKVWPRYSLKFHGEEYEAYRRQVPMLIPLPKKAAATMEATTPTTT